MEQPSFRTAGCIDFMELLHNLMKNLTDETTGGLFVFNMRRMLPFCG